ncbi:RNA polymerase sigma factor [Edaphobacter flagellatus]|uniref:RNA polymerase sigma factor n=1 Tax=Edaphobacter flagellatus TaxID=1933044 RepID=UPI0021B3D77B|nr:sigma-70 family RNA polymerase sigma factor [Edaphobacter flagellatus]
MEENDPQIVRAVLAGDKDAYGALVARHSQNVFRVAFRITGDEADADEVVQEAFMRGYQRLQSFESRSGFGTWIYRIAVNCALNMVNKRKPGTNYQIAEETDPSQRQVQVADYAAGPERTLLSREIEALQTKALNKLTATERTAFVLRHMEERSTTEIAEALNIAPNAAKQTVFRAVQKLRRSLAPLRVTQ